MAWPAERLEMLSVTWHQGCKKIGREKRNHQIRPLIEYAEDVQLVHWSRKLVILRLWLEKHVRLG
jgi:hypothetical protein